MKRNAFRLVSVLMSLLMISGAVSAAGAEADTEYEKVEVFCRTDIILHSSKKYDNPYKDVQIDAVFTHESGESISLYGFWYGGDEWHVRFAPTKTGIWSYRIVCSDEENDGLHEQTGKLRAVKNTGKTELDKHGFVKISDNGRYFVYDDGTPFYWLGDTNWQAPNYVSLTQCNYPGCSCGNQFMHEVNDRVAKGFTVYQTYFDSSESDGGGQRSVTTEPSMWLKKYGMIDPDTFKNKFDVMFDYLAAKGMVIALGFGVHSITVNAMSDRELQDISRYLTARYASYPVIWITAQEITGDEQFDKWEKSAKIVEKGDGYGHPQSAHQYPIEASDTYAVRLGGSEWHDFYALQNGHGPRIADKSTYKGYWDNKPLKGRVKPFVETEANYEDIYCGGFNGYDASRISAWKANLCGSYGFTYGVTGVWANCYSTTGNTGWMGTFSTEPWYMGIDKPGSYEMQYMARFFRMIDFSSLVPRFGSKTYSNLRDEDKVLASSDDAKTYVAYFYNTDRSTGELGGLDKTAAYSAYWYDPLTGHFIEAGSGITSGNGRYTIPEKPTKGDWVFLLTSKGINGEYTTEPLPADGEENAYENALSGADSSCSSRSSVGSDAASAIDGNDGTWWCASDGRFPQWISFDMKAEKNFDTVSVKMHQSATGATYTVEGGNDGKTWTKLLSGEKEPLRGNTFTHKTDSVCSYRYLRIRFDEVQGSWAAVTEVSVYLSGDKVPAEFSGTVQKPGVKCTGRARYPVGGMLKDSAVKLTDGDLSKVWEPFAAESTQTIILDMYETKPVYGINIILGEDSVTPDYRIEGSSDGENWYVLKNSTLSMPSVYGSDEYVGRKLIREALSGNFRYIKLIVMGAPSKDNVKKIAEIELYAEGETADAPASADTSSLLSLYNRYKSVKNTGKKYTQNRFRALTLALSDAADALTGKSGITAEQVRTAEEKLKTAAEKLSEPDEAAADPTDTSDTADDSDASVTTAKEAEGDASRRGKALWIVGAVAAAAAAAAAVIALLKHRRGK